VFDEPLRSTAATLFVHFRKLLQVLKAQIVTSSQAVRQQRDTKQRAMEQQVRKPKQPAEGPDGASSRQARAMKQN